MLKILFLGTTDKSAEVIMVEYIYVETFTRMYLANSQKLSGNINHTRLDIKGIHSMVHSTVLLYW